MDQQILQCPHCPNDREDQIDRIYRYPERTGYYCVCCSRTFEVMNDKSPEDNASSRDTKKEIPKPDSN